MNTSLDSTTRKLWILIIGNALNFTAIYIAIPYINLYLLERFNLSPAYIGFISGIWYITIFLVSFFCGIIAERQGYINTLRAGILVALSGFFIMSISTEIITFCVSLFLCGLGRALMDASGRAAIFALAGSENAERYFRIRYLLQNVGCIIGPLIGIMFYGKLFGKTFAISSLTFLLFFAITFIGLRNKDFKYKMSLHQPNIIKNLSVLKNPTLLLWIVSGVFLLGAYGGHEQLMPLFIANSNGSRPEFGYLISINGVVVIVFQLCILKLFKNLSIKRAVNCGYILMAIGMALFMVEWRPFEMTIISIIILSAGESILFPCLEVTLGRMAPDDKKAIYFGAGELKQAGFFIGPAIGGIILEYSGAYVLFTIFALAIVFSHFLFYKSL